MWLSGGGFGRGFSGGVRLGGRGGAGFVGGSGGSDAACVFDGGEGVRGFTGDGLLAAGLAAFFEKALDGLFAFFFCGLLFLAEGFFDGAIAFLIIEFAEIVGFAFAQAAPLPGGGILFHLR